MEKGMGASGVTLECKHNHDVNGDRSVIKRPNAERTAYVKVSNGDRARALLLAEQKSSYQARTDDKKNVHSPFARTKHRKASQRRIKESTPPGSQPDHADGAEGAKAGKRR